MLVSNASHPADHCELSSLGWLLQRAPTPPSTAAPGGADLAVPLRSLEPANEKGRRARRILGQSRSSPYASTTTVRQARRRLGGPVYWSSHGETGVTEDGDELDTHRPPFSFTCLIGMAILKSGATHISVGEIYRYMVRNFPYFKTAKQTWRNSVRHVLSLGKYFCKRSKGSTQHDELGPCVGKGAVWSVKGAMLPSLLRHIELGAAQLTPSAAKHLGLANLATVKAAVAAAADPALPVQFPALEQLGHHGADLAAAECAKLGIPGMLPGHHDADLDGMTDLELDMPPPGSPTGSISSCAGSDVLSALSDEDVEVPDLEAPDVAAALFPALPAATTATAPAPEVAADWLDRSLDAQLALDIAALLDGDGQHRVPATPMAPEPEPGSFESWFSLDTAIAGF